MPTHTAADEQPSLRGCPTGTARQLRLFYLAALFLTGLASCFAQTTMRVPAAEHSGVHPPVQQSQPLDSAEDEIRNQHYAEAIALLQPVVQARPDSAQAHYDLAYALFRVRNNGVPLQENLSQSIREAARSLELDQSSADAHKVLGLDLTMIGRDDLAGREFAEAVRLQPASAENRYFLGRYLMRQGKYPEAASELREAVRLAPEDKKACQNLGLTLQHLGSPEEAQLFLRRAVRLDQEAGSHSEEPYLDLAGFYRQKGGILAALPLALQASVINPHSEEAYLELGLLYRAGRNWPDALTALLKAAALNPRDAETQYLLGRTFYALGDRQRSDEAFTNFNRLRREEPSTPPVPGAPPSERVQP